MAQRVGNEMWSLSPLGHCYKQCKSIMTKSCYCCVSQKNLILSSTKTHLYCFITSELCFAKP